MTAAWRFRGRNGTLALLSVERERRELKKVIELMGERAKRQDGMFSVQGVIVEVLLSIRLARLRN